MNSLFPTPILFLIFNRPDVTQKVFEQIRRIRPKYLFVAADGPRLDNSYDSIKCWETRAIIDNVDWECDIKTLFRDKNLGCGKAVSSAISWFFDYVEYGIILEDDCMPDLSFFPYCEELLIKYKDDERIMHIGGNNFQSRKENGNKSTIGSYYFSNYAHIWGWATWKRSWKYYNFEMEDYLKTFNFGGFDYIFQSKSEKKYWKRIFFKMHKKEINTWDYQWTFSIWRRRGLSITPNVNLVINLGLENNSSHIFFYDSFKNDLNLNIIEFPIIHPILTIDYFADKFTFDNLYSHSINRMFRLFKENGVFRIAKHILKK